MRPGEGGMEKREEEGVSVKEIHTKEKVEEEAEVV